MGGGQQQRLHIINSHICRRFKISCTFSHANWEKGKNQYRFSDLFNAVLVSNHVYAATRYTHSPFVTYLSNGLFVVRVLAPLRADSLSLKRLGNVVVTWFGFGEASSHGGPRHGGTPGEEAAVAEEEEVVVVVCV